MCIFYSVNLSAFIGCFVKILIKTNVKISNDIHFSDVYRRLNCAGSLTKFT